MEMICRCDEAGIRLGAPRAGGATGGPARGRGPRARLRASALGSGWRWSRSRRMPRATASRWLARSRRGLGASGVTVLSGMACVGSTPRPTRAPSRRGIRIPDAGSLTIAVLPGPAERPYPAGQRGLYRPADLAPGVAVSERPAELEPAATVVPGPQQDGIAAALAAPDRGRGGHLERSGDGPTAATSSSAGKCAVGAVLRAGSRRPEAAGPNALLVVRRRGDPRRPGRARLPVRAWPWRPVAPAGSMEFARRRLSWSAATAASARGTARAPRGALRRGGDRAGHGPGDALRSSSSVAGCRCGPGGGFTVIP